MRDWSSDDEGPDPDYGPDLSNPIPPRTLSEREIAELKRWRLKQAQERKVSSDFNRHMIDTFNARKP